MALLHTQQYASNYNELHINNLKAQYGVVDHTVPKWMYLISNNIRFATKCEGAIRIAKPDDDILYQWLERIAVAGQCSVLFVEALSLDDFRMQKIKSICELNSVTLVNFTLDNTLPGNLVLGPW